MEIWRVDPSGERIKEEWSVPFGQKPICSILQEIVASHRTGLIYLTLSVDEERELAESVKALFEASVGTRAAHALGSFTDWFGKNYFTGVATGYFSEDPDQTLVQALAARRVHLAIRIQKET